VVHSGSVGPITPMPGPNFIILPSRAVGHILYIRNNLLSSPDVNTEGMTTAREARKGPI
jgi:hypothetical protein